MAKISTSLFGELAIIPIQPQLPIRESLEWLTDVSDSYTGAQESQALRSIPRRAYDYQYQLWSEVEQQDGFNTASGAIRDLWAIPMWPDNQYVGDIASGATSVSCDIENYPLSADTLALLYSPLTSAWQILEILTASSGTITFSAATAQTGAYLVPVRTGRIVGNINKQTAESHSVLSATWRIDESPVVVPATPPQFAGYDLYTSCPYMTSTTLDRVFSQRDEIADFEIGSVESSSPWIGSRYGTPYSVLGFSLAEIRVHREFFFRRMGRYRLFWAPTFERNLTSLNSGTITTQLNVNDNGLTDYAPQRLHLAILKTDGTWITITAISVAVLTGTTARYTFASALNIDASDIKLVAYLGLNRLDSDRIEINYTATDIAEFAYTVLELSP